MTEPEHLVIFSLVTFCVSVIAALFMLGNPVAKTRRAKLVNRYFAACFLLLCAGSAFFLFRSAIFEPLSLVFTNLLFVVGLYCLKYGLLWRRGHTLHLAKNREAFKHMSLFVLSQLLLWWAVDDSLPWRTLNLSANAIALMLFCLPLINLSRTQTALFGERYTWYSLNFLTISFAILPLTYWLSDSIGQFQSWVLVLCLLGLFVLFAGLQCLLMSDAIEEHYQTSIRDPLTGIFNRRYFFQQVKQVAAMQQPNTINSVLLIDIDHFKDINEHYGHDVGDAVITHFAHLLTDLTGNKGLVSRFAGEEFAILLRQHSLPDALKFAEQLRHASQSVELPTDKGQVKLTASFGVAEIWDMPAIDLTIKLADDALIAAKSAGRNCVCAA